MFCRQGGLRAVMWVTVICFCADAGLAETVKKEPLRLSLRGTILTSLAHNRDLRVRILQPAITRTLEGTERAVFDPVLGGAVSTERKRDRAAGRVASHTMIETVTGEVFIEEFLPTGTTIRAGAETSSIHSDLYTDHFTATRAGVTVTQALLQGMPIGVNLASLRQARLNTQISEYELRGFVEALVAEVEGAYWEYALALREVAIVQESKDVAERQLRETRERVNVGRISEAELAAAAAEVALRKEELIDAEGTREKARLKLLRLMTLAGGAVFAREVTLTDDFVAAGGKLDAPASHVAVALRMRPDLNQARLGAKRGDLEITRTKNGLLPQLDFFLALGTTGYNETFGGAARNVNGHHYDVSAGLTLEYPLLNRAARAAHRGATLSHRQLLRAVDNLAQLVELEVRTACVEAQRAQGMVAATAATSALRAESLRAETEKFKVGKSSSFLVARAQRDLLASRLKEVRAMAAHLRALTSLYRLEGSLLERRGLITKDEGWM